MRLFDRIPDRFFTILTSSKKGLYIQALFVLRQAFKTELIIRRTDLAAMIMDSLETDMMEADFSEEADEIQEIAKPDFSLSGKAYLLIRKLKETGWIEVEYESKSFEENITIPDYAIAVMNLLYELSTEEIKEYNSYVFATYAALQNAKENPDYLYQALQAAYQNTVRLVDELKLLFNNIKRYYQRITAKLSVNELLAEHFDYYKDQIIDTIYYPLKTIDSVPRFKHAILLCLNEWVLQGDAVDTMAAQGVQRRIYATSEDGREDVLQKINYIANTFENIESMIGEIDKKHVEYTNASIDRIRYMMNADRSIKGKLVELLKHSAEAAVFGGLQDNIIAYQHRYLDENSLYDRVRRTVKTEGIATPIEETLPDDHLIESFLGDIRRQYSTRKVDDFVEACFAGKETFQTEELGMDNQEAFILFMLGTMRAGQKGAGYYVEFLQGSVERGDYRLPKLIFHRKGKETNAGRTI